MLNICVCLLNILTANSSSCDYYTWSHDYSRSRKAGGGMQLGKKKKNIETFVGQVEAEGGCELLVIVMILTILPF